MARKVTRMMTIVIPLTSLNCDPVQYKPYDPIYDLSAIAVEIQIPADLFLRHDKKTGRDIFKPEAVPVISHQLSLVIAANYRPVLATNR